MNKDSAAFKAILKVIGVIQSLRAVFHILLFNTSPAKEIIGMDMARWLHVTRKGELANRPNWDGLVWLVRKYPEFRNLFYYRVAQGSNLLSRVLLEIAKFFFKPMDTLHIHTPSIGPGLFIQHGTSTFISAESIGENCWINQQVTIGYSNPGECPAIGSHVTVTAGAKVFGNITIGNNSVIGANAVVVKNIPPNCTVVGIPAFIIKRDGKKVKLPL